MRWQIQPPLSPPCGRPAPQRGAQVGFVKTMCISPVFSLSRLVPPSGGMPNEVRQRGIKSQPTHQPRCCGGGSKGEGGHLRASELSAFPLGTLFGSFFPCRKKELPAAQAKGYCTTELRCKYGQAEILALPIAEIYSLRSCRKRPTVLFVVPRSILR